ncbi:MAG: NAD(P)/FAD-dependent oxidoreductase [Eubacterium sp.]|nr:NAD(P)/FAD-dependent oxidoreductase [Eubacterium sp.]
MRTGWHIPGIVLEIDLKPGLSDEELDRRIIRDFEEFHNRDFQNSLGKLLPRLLIPVVIEKSGISPGKKVNSITSEERRKLLNVLKHFKLSVKRLRQFDEAIITGGGVSVKEINPHNMELKKIRNLRVAGEVIDCDALTGGFNLQIAWSTAYMAAQ